MAEIEKGSLDYATRRATMRREIEDRVAPLGMTGLGVTALMRGLGVTLGMTGQGALKEESD